MSEKRRDSKGRILQNGERQRPNGQYEYRYKDAKGDFHSVYSWRLVESDKIPPGKKKTSPLRSIEADIAKDISDNISTYEAKKYAVNDMFDLYMSVKKGLKQSTTLTYKYLYDNYVRPTFGARNISSIKYSDVKIFYNDLLLKKDLKPSSLELINAMVHPVFALAVRDNIIRTNPADGVMREIKRSNNWERTKRHALTIPEQEALVEYCKRSGRYNQWMPMVTVLLGTGCRVSELAGLRWQDCDFVNDTISINHNLIYISLEDGKKKKIITTPKTEAGKRTIPMLTAVKKALLELYDKQIKGSFCTETVDGFSGFIFKTANNTVQTPQNIDSIIRRITESYNKKEKEAASSENRIPLLLPHFTAHHLRHTFCTRFCENETNIKVIQDIMGHANITTTMNIYNEATMDKKTESISNLNSKIKIS